MFIWMKIKNMDDVYDFVMKECLSESVMVMPGHAFYPDSTKSCSCIRLCYSQATDEDVEKVFKFFFFNSSKYYQKDPQNFFLIPKIFESSPNLGI